MSTDQKAGAGIPFNLSLDKSISFIANVTGYPDNLVW